jgi:hypothetical protein
MHGTVSLSSLTSLPVSSKLHHNLQVGVTSTSERPPKFLLLCNRVRSYKLIIAYHVYYDYYKIDRNKESKIAVHKQTSLILISRSIFIDNHGSRL